MRTRLGFALVAAVLAMSSCGSSTADTPRFAFSQTELSGPGAPQLDHEVFPVVVCQWPDGKTSITVAQARAVSCFPRGSFPTRREWFLLESPIGGAKYPVQNGHLSDDVRLVRRSKISGVMSVSPVLLQFGDYSGGARPSIVIAGRSIWIYDYRTERGPEVVRISTVTGAILQRTLMPAISRPTCSATRAGFWMGQAGNSLYSKSVVLGIWYAPIGAAKGVLVRRTPDFVYWITSSGSSTEAVVAPPPGGGHQKAYLWRFTPSHSS